MISSSPLTLPSVSIPAKNLSAAEARVTDVKNKVCSRGGCGRCDAGKLVELRKEVSSIVDDVSELSTLVNADEDDNVLAMIAAANDPTSKMRNRLSRSLGRCRIASWRYFGRTVPALRCSPRL